LYAYFIAQFIINLDMSGNSGRSFRYRIEINSMFATFSINNATFFG